MSGLYWVIGGAVLVAAVLIGTSLVGNRPAEAPSAAGGKSVNRNVMGSATAKVKLVEYGDYL